MATLLKISGLASRHEVDVALGVGAWALGFTVTGEVQRSGAPAVPSPASEPKSLSPRRAADLAAATHDLAEGALTVASVAGADPRAIVAAAAMTGVGAVEIGPEADAAAVRAAMKAGGLSDMALIAARDAANAGEADFVVFMRGDAARAAAPSPSSLQGGRTPAVWDPFTRPALKRIIVAGDLDAGSVSDVVRTVHPFAIDVGGAVRTPGGVLDEVRLRELAVALVGADAIDW